MCNTFLCVLTQITFDIVCGIEKTPYHPAVKVETGLLQHTNILKSMNSLKIFVSKLTIKDSTKISREKSSNTFANNYSARKRK